MVRSIYGKSFSTSISYHAPITSSSAGGKIRISTAGIPKIFCQFLTRMILISICYFFLFRCHDQMVIPTRMRDTTSQIRKWVVGNAPAFPAIFMKAIIPVTTTRMVSIRGILRESFILFLFYSPFRSIHEMPFSVEYPPSFTSYAWFCMILQNYTWAFMGAVRQISNNDHSRSWLAKFL